MIVSKSKYRNQKTVYDGIIFDSKKEAAYCKALDLSKFALNIKERVLGYERQVPYKIIINGILVCRYILDFKVHYADARIEYVDVKGMKTSVYELKKKLMLALHDISIMEK